MKGPAGPVEKRLANLEATKTQEISVAIFGAGRASADFAKREQIRDHLLQLSYVGEVVLPEEIAEAHGDLTTDQVERAAVDDSDLVIGVDGPDPTYGLASEVMAYLTYDNSPKWYLVVPSGAPLFADTPGLATNIASDHSRGVERFLYDPAWWAECERIRLACATRADRIVSRLMLPGAPPIQSRLGLGATEVNVTLQSGTSTAQSD